MKVRIKKYFYTGILALLPIILTSYLIGWIGKKVFWALGNNILVEKITDILLGFDFVSNRVEAEVYVKGIVAFTAVVISILAITLVGMALQMVIGRKIAEYIRNVLIRVPIVKSIYTTFSQITELISSKQNNSYKKVLLVEYPRKGVYSIGFLTSENNEYFEEITGRRKLYNVFVPTSPNPTSGLLLMVEEKEVIVLDLKVEEAIKLVISGGVIVPEEIAQKSK